MKIYRIEHKADGVGPLCGRHISYWHEYFHDHDAVECTSGASRWMMCAKNTFYFGANTKAFIYRILKSDKFHILESLDEMGFIGVVYDTDDVFVCDDGQVIFLKKNASVVQYDLFTFFQDEYDSDTNQDCHRK